MFTWISSQTVFTSEQILIFQLMCLGVVCSNSGLTGRLFVVRQVVTKRPNEIPPSKHSTDEGFPLACPCGPSAKLQQVRD